MSVITDVKCVLSQKAFDAFFEKFHIPEEVHHVLPNQGDTMHERPAGKIGLYTRFFDFANFRLPLSTFVVNIIKHFRINISQLSVIGAAKTKPLDSLKNWNDHFFWVDDFACPARFLWHTAKNVTRDPAPTAADFNAQDYATLVAHPSSFRKFPEEFLCLVGLSRHYTLDEETYPSFLDKDGEDMDIFAFIQIPDPTKVKIAERERIKGEPRLLETTIGRTIPLLPVTPDRGESKLEASVDKLFDEGGSGTQAEQGDSAGGGGGGGKGPRRQKKRKPLVVDVGVPSHPPEKLRGDHETPSVPSVAGKSKSAVQRLLAGVVLNVEFRGEPIPILPFVTSSVSATPEHEGGDHTDSMTGLNLQTIRASQRSTVPLMMTVTTVIPTVDSTAITKEKTVKPSLFGVDSSSADRTDPTPGGFFDRTGSDFLVGEWNLTNSLLSLMSGMLAKCLLVLRDEEIENLKAQMLLKEAEVAEAICLRAEASKFKIVEKSLRDEVNALVEHNTILEKERNALDVKVANLEASVISNERELTDSNAQLTSVKSQNGNLIDQVSSSRLKEKLSNYENLTERLEEFQDAQLKVVNDKFDKLYADFVEIALYLEEKIYPHLLTTISSPSIGKAIEKGMQDGLSAGITHGKEGRVLTDVATYNPSTKVDYVSALQQLQNVNFSLLAELKTNKDASVEILMNILRLEETLAKRLGLSEPQPHVDQLMVPIHHSPDKTVVGASVLSLALGVSDAWPFSAAVITGAEGTSDVVPAIVGTTAALSITFASASTVTPISVDDYEVTGTDDQAAANENVTDGNANPFPNVDDAELNIPQ
ncbi:hypothetical protein Tco_0522946 [Tanacetum coccineum]